MVKPVSAALESYIALARAGGQATPAFIDLYTWTFPTIAAMRWADSNARVVVAGESYDPGPILSRGRIRTGVNMEVGGLDVTLAGAYVLPNGSRLSLAVANGMFEYARVKIEQLVMPVPGDMSLGTVYLYEGRVAECAVTSNEVRISIKSEMEVLGTQQLPRRLFQSSCPYGVYDAGCGLSEALFQKPTQVGSGSTTQVLRTGLTDATGYFDLGWVTFTSGLLGGVRRSVRSYANTNGALTLAIPLPMTPAVGDALVAVPGCDKTTLMCNTKFGNLQRNGGFPFVPSSDSVV